jgi:hypothetical protein
METLRTMALDRVMSPNEITRRLDDIDMRLKRLEQLVLVPPISEPLSGPGAMESLDLAFGTWRTAPPPHDEPECDTYCFATLGSDD